MPSISAYLSKIPDSHRSKRAATRQSSGSIFGNLLSGISSVLGNIVTKGNIVAGLEDSILDLHTTQLISQV
ncbi:hypothetical protein [Tropheryma whipplei]|uniref:hypothetical protein n=1 Tax=Tropheryma whipplei TaxID=2039 RepID=UPI0011D11F5D|nr:hypothetical protein [Tropheryma whipplei]